MQRRRDTDRRYGNVTLSGAGGRGSGHLLVKATRLCDVLVLWRIYKFEIIQNDSREVLKSSFFKLNKLLPCSSTHQGVSGEAPLLGGV